MKPSTGKPANVVIRGLSEKGFELRPQIKLASGRLFRPGSTEIIVGSGIAKNFAGASIGSSIRFAQRDWVVVGIFDGGGSGFDSEVWGDGDQLMQSFRRNAFSTMIMRVADDSGYERLKADVDSDPRLSQEVKREQLFYSDQSRALSTFINVLGITLSVIFSIGAMIGAMITMYASVANRTGEIGTLRALGFKRNSVLIAFLGESLLLGFVGGLAGLGFASLMQFASFSTTNFQTFADLTFRFVLTPIIIVEALIFSLLMGLIGGFLPAMRAARLKIVDSLRAA
jgi:ABC-type antimicrobial peptide transport system permease subunit